MAANKEVGGSKADMSETKLKEMPSSDLNQEVPSQETPKIQEKSQPDKTLQRGDIPKPGLESLVGTEYVQGKRSDHKQKASKVQEKSQPDKTLQRGGVPKPGLESLPEVTPYVPKPLLKKLGDIRK
ncbi:MAG: hypothetical protein V4489_07200 [Chlamydiota bacterium]